MQKESYFVDIIEEQRMSKIVNFNAGFKAFEKLFKTANVNSAIFSYYLQPYFGIHFAERAIPLLEKFLPFIS